MSKSDGLFVRVRRCDHPMRDALTDRSFGDIVEEYARQIEEIKELSPYRLRASFITLTLESEASVEQTQYAAIAVMKTIVMGMLADLVAGVKLMFKLAVLALF